MDTASEPGIDSYQEGTILGTLLTLCEIDISGCIMSVLVLYYIPTAFNIAFHWERKSNKYLVNGLSLKEQILNKRTQKCQVHNMHSINSDSLAFSFFFPVQKTLFSLHGII